jgi:hypothetical protein
MADITGISSYPKETGKKDKREKTPDKAHR